MSEVRESSSASRPYDPVSYLRANAARGEKIALLDGEREISFPQLLGIVEGLVADLGERAVRTGTVVAVALPNVWQYVALEIAIPAAGGIVLPLPMSLGRLEMTGALSRSGAALVFTDASPTGDLLREVAAVVNPAPTVLDVGRLPFEHASGGGLDPDDDPDRVVQIALTSGTTGLPKLASLTARLKQVTFEGFTSRLEIGPGDRVLPMSPITQGAGEMCLYCLRTGAALVMTGRQRFDPAALFRLIEAGRATVIGAVPTMLVRMLNAPQLETADLSLVQATLSAGAPLSPAVARAWEERTGSRVCNFYGAMDIGQLAVPSPADPPQKRWTTVGRPHDVAEVLICAPDGTPVEPGAEGEICMRGSLVQDRYWGEAFGPYGEDGWAHFGDLGVLDVDGYLQVTGRLKDTIIRGGTNINPYEVEEVLRDCLGVADICVVGRPDADLGERTVVVVVPKDGAAPGLDDLLAHLDDRGVARFKWPEDLISLSALPLGSTGKVDRGRLRSLVADERKELD